ncbi:hypothetical protein FQA39_LY08043 [Lamprigera yunnana]|nr:hypothetical protein FQA39_LY08043 [Lamprigera yunnana]
MKRKSSGRATSRMLCLTALAAKTNKNGLMGAECTYSKCQVEETLESTCFQRRLHRQVVSPEERGASFGNVKSAFTT